MKTYTFVCIGALVSVWFVPANAQSFSISTPDDEQRTAIEVLDPDRDVRTLGTPEIAFDLSASHDTLLDLRIRRSGLSLPGGQPFTAFAGHREENLIVLAGGPVAHIEITGVSHAGSSREALVLFKDANGTLIAPKEHEVAVFDTDFNPLPLRYLPASIPRHALLPVTLLLDVSGSMSAHMSDVVAASNTFLTSLPLYARCRLFTFNDEVKELILPGGHKVPVGGGVDVHHSGTPTVRSRPDGARPAPDRQGADRLCGGRAGNRCADQSPA